MTQLSQQLPGTDNNPAKNDNNGSNCKDNKNLVRFVIPAQQRTRPRTGTQVSAPSSTSFQLQLRMPFAIQSVTCECSHRNVDFQPELELSEDRKSGKVTCSSTTFLHEAIVFEITEMQHDNKVDFFYRVILNFFCYRFPFLCLFEIVRCVVGMESRGW